MNLKNLFNAILFCLGLGATVVSAKPILIVTTDIGGGDADDIQSMVRLLHYSNEFDIKGLISSSHLHSTGTSPELINDLLVAYGDVRSNLLKHASGYPALSTLRDSVAEGQPYAGISVPVFDSIGSGRDTDGSRKIVSVVDQSSGPVNIAIWGGSADLAQALWSVRQQRSSSQLAEFVAKIKVHAIAHQDSTGPWIVSNFPELFYVLDYRQDSSIVSPFRGMYIGGDETTTSPAWLRQNIVENHGNLGTFYPSSGLWTAPNPYGAMKEGDTPSFFYFLDNGLQDSSKPGYGGWGGRYSDAAGNLWSANEVDGFSGSDGTPRTTVARFRATFNNDFAARSDWAANGNFGAANHHPLAVLNGDSGKSILYLSAAPNTTVTLSAGGSSDPDGNGLSYKWWQYREAGSYGGSIAMSGISSESASFKAPDVSAAANLHVILEVTDNGVPALTSYRRIVVTVDPALTGVGNDGAGAGDNLGSVAGAIVATLSWNSSTTGPNSKDEAIIQVDAHDVGGGRVAVMATMDLAGGVTDNDYMVNPWVKLGSDKRQLYNGRVGGQGAEQKVPYSATVYFDQPPSGAELTVGYDSYYDGSWRSETANGGESSRVSEFPVSDAAPPTPEVPLEPEVPLVPEVPADNGDSGSADGAALFGFNWSSTTTGPNTKDEAIISVEARDTGDGRMAVSATLDLAGGATDNDYMVDPWVQLGGDRRKLYNGRVGGQGAQRKVPYSTIVYFDQPASTAELTVGYDSYYDGSWRSETSNGGESSRVGAFPVSEPAAPAVPEVPLEPEIPADNGDSDSADGAALFGFNWSSTNTGPNTKDEAIISVEARDTGDGRLAVSATLDLAGGATDNDYMVDPWVQLGGDRRKLYNGSVGGQGAQRKVPYSTIVYFDQPASAAELTVGYDSYYDGSWRSETGNGGESSSAGAVIASNMAVGGDSVSSPVLGSYSWSSSGTGPNSKDEAIISIDAMDMADGRIAVTATIDLAGGSGDDDYIVGPWVQLGTVKLQLYSGRVGGQGAEQKVPYTTVKYFDKPAYAADWSLGYDSYFDRSWPGETTNGAESSGRL